MAVAMLFCCTLAQANRISQLPLFNHFIQTSDLNHFSSTDLPLGCKRVVSEAVIQCVATECFNGTPTNVEMNECRL